MLPFQILPQGTFTPSDHAHVGRTLEVERTGRQHRTISLAVVGPPFTKTLALRNPSSPLPTQDFDDLLGLLTELPDAADAFAAMRRYVRAVAQFSDFPSAQTVTRIKAQLRTTMDPVRKGELQYEIEVAERDASSTIPRIVWGSILVAIYATFETGVQSLLVYWGNNVPGAAAFRVGGQGQFLKKAQSFALKEITVPLFAASTLRDAVLELKEFRDSFAHAAGRMPDRRTELHSAIAKARKKNLLVKVEDETWIATPKLAAYYLVRTEQAYRAFSHAVMDQYVARKMRPPEA